LHFSESQDKFLLAQENLGEKLQMTEKEGTFCVKRFFTSLTQTYDHSLILMVPIEQTYTCTDNAATPPF
jgi:hypothetical protein